MYNLTELSAFFLLVIVVAWWWRSRDLHGMALRSARKYCQTRNIQLLDESLVFKKFAFTKAANGRRYFSRIYTFEFCMDGTDRYEGEIILSGYSVIRVMLDAEVLEITEY